MARSFNQGCSGSLPSSPFCLLSHNAVPKDHRSLYDFDRLNGFDSASFFEIDCYGHNIQQTYCAMLTAVYMAVVGSFPCDSFLLGVLSCVGTAVLAVCFRIQVSKENKEFEDLPPERAFADFVLCNLVQVTGLAGAILGAWSGTVLT